MLFFIHFHTTFTNLPGPAAEKHDAAATVLHSGDVMFLVEHDNLADDKRKGNGLIHKEVETFARRCQG